MARGFVSECRNMYACMQEDIDFAIIRASDLMGEKRSFLRKVSVFFTPPILCIFLYRLSHLFWVMGFKVVASFIGWINFVLHKASLSPVSEIGGGLYLPHTVGVLFHGVAGKRLILFANAIVASNLMALEVSNQTNEYPVLGDDVLVGARATILGGVKIGNCCRIASYTVVNENLPPNTLAFSKAQWRPR